MSKISTLFILSLLFMPGMTVLANTDFETSCAEWAADDRISEEKMPAFLKKCIKDLTDEENQSQEVDREKELAE